MPSRNGMRQPQAAREAGLRNRGEQRPGGGPEDQAQRDRRLLEAGVPAAVTVWRPFRHEGRRTAPLAAGGKPLDQPRHHQQCGRRHANAGIARQHADQHGAERHRHDGERQCGLPPARVAEATNDDAAQRAHQESDAEHGEGSQQGGGAIAAGKEDPANRRCEEHVDAEVVPLQHVANRGGEHRLAGFVQCGSHCAP